MQPNMCLCPRYKLLWLRHVREKKGWGDEQVQRFIVRNYDLTMKWIVLPESELLQVRQRGVGRDKGWTFLTQGRCTSDRGLTYI